MANCVRRKKKNYEQYSLYQHNKKKENIQIEIVRTYSEDGGKCTLDKDKIIPARN